MQQTETERGSDNRKPGYFLIMTVSDSEGYAPDHLARVALDIFMAPENSESFRHSVIVSGLIPARRLASSSVNPTAIA